MSNFEVKVRRIDAVEDHPDADRLSIVSILGYRAITAKKEDGSHRYQPGDLVVYVPEAAVVPHDLLKQYGYWNEEKDIGMLAGKQGDRVKIVRLRGVYSQGLVWPVSFDKDMIIDPTFEFGHFVTAGGYILNVNEGDDVAEFFGITKYEPPVPAAMNGDAAGIPEFALTYDFDSIQRWPNFFEAGEPVVVTEKLHGTFTRISYRRHVSDDRLFGPNKNIAIASKGLGAKGIVFIDTEANRAGNVYVKSALANDLIAKIEQMADSLGCDALDIFGETFGPGIQRFNYGLSKPEFRAFDLRIDRQYADAASVGFNFVQHGIAEVPLLYDGPFDMTVIAELRDAPIEWQGAKHVREGVVIKAAGSQTAREHNGERIRPILKAVSPAYLLKEDGTEIQ
jgi:RNA ligase (TIGR02306 family)